MQQENVVLILSRSGHKTTLSIMRAEPDDCRSCMYDMTVTIALLFVPLRDSFCVQVARGGNMVPAMIDTKLMTRETYTLYGIEGDFGNKDGKLTFTEKVSFFSRPLAYTDLLCPVVFHSLCLVLSLLQWVVSTSDVTGCIPSCLSPKPTAAEPLATASGTGCDAAQMQSVLSREILKLVLNCERECRPSS